MIPNGKLVNIFEYASEISKQTESLYINNASCREHLLEFFENNEFFNLPYKKSEKDLMMNFKDVESIAGAIKLWVTAYKKESREKNIILLNCFKGIYPITCKYYWSFITQTKIETKEHSWKLLDYMLSEINKEIVEYDESEISIFIEKMYAETTVIVAKTFSEFLKSIVINGKPLTEWKYTFESHEKYVAKGEAYTIQEFSIMAYHIFNEKMWEKQNLIRKAIQSESNAEMWLFVALHFVCALRTTDIRRIPAPQLPFDKNTLFDMILNNKFPKQEARKISEDMCFRIKLKGMKPSKTSAYSNVTDLKLFVPESLLEPLGVIIAIVLAHHSGKGYGKSLFDTDKRFFWRISQIRNFFGADFIKCLGERRFSSLRTNRAYLQGIDSVANIDNEFGKPKGYMVAALARSHKAGIGTLSNTTEIYLKDANFTGYSPEFIMREMFERGVFSFIPAVLLEIFTGEEFLKLPVTSQTKLICKIGITPYQIEEVISAVDRVLQKSKKIVNEICKDRKSAFNILQNIVSGNAPGYSDGYFCLRNAANLPCIDTGRNSCLGCGYEIYTKATMHLLINEYIRLMNIKKTSSLKTDVIRSGAILEKIIIPAVGEMLTVLENFYTKSDMNDLIDTIERRLEDAGSNI